MKIRDLMNVENYRCEESTRDLEIKNIVTHHSKIESESLFVLLRGRNSNASEFTDNIIQKRPRAILCDTDNEIDYGDIPVIKVGDTRKTLPFVLSKFYGIDYTKMKFIGITGTNGKTSTATMLYEILMGSNHKVGFIGTGKIKINNTLISDKYYSMTTPDPELLYWIIAKMQEEKCSFVIMEVSSHSLFYEKVAAIPFEIGIFTNLSHEHMDFHENLEEYYSCKLKLFEKCKIGLFNIDDDYGKRALEQAKCKSIGVGTSSDADITAKEIHPNGFDGSEYIYRDRKRIFKVRLSIPGYHNVYNSMMAIAASIELGITPCEAKATISEITEIDGRFEILRDDITVIIDYAHTPDALKKLMFSINTVKNKWQKVFLVFGCGGERDKKKRPLMGMIAEENADTVFITSDNSRCETEMEIANDILNGFKDKQSPRIIISRPDAITQAIIEAPDGTIVAIVGKGHERYNIDKNGYHRFDEREIISKALRQRKKIKNENNSRHITDT